MYNFHVVAYFRRQQGLAKVNSSWGLLRLTRNKLIHELDDCLNATAQTE